jgi:signal transduction histidine kinase
MRGHPRTRIAVACFLSFLAGGAVVLVTKRSLISLWFSVVEQRGLCVYDAHYTDGGLSPLDMEFECPPATVPERFLYVGLVVACLGVVLLVLFQVARRVLAPIAAMADIVRQLGPQNLAQRISYGGPRDEVRDLADALDEMLDRMATGYEGQRRFAANASHELRTPLAVQRTLVEVAVDTGARSVSSLADGERHEPVTPGAGGRGGSTAPREPRRTTRHHPALPGTTPNHARRQACWRMTSKTPATLSVGFSVSMRLRTRSSAGRTSDGATPVDRLAASMYSSACRLISRLDSPAV